ncbi:phage tail tape measure protein [Pseudomonas syringae]|uniref:phage tail tape measure protein n=1 Tax=Pseudomonas syringae TaxID=317 RepID=UPI001F17C773|nr:phage tail tape measure protein [Pseudomonas syringae]MCF5721031.1 phage tail tape measure protein [Pseudomonas syringae]
MSASASSRLDFILALTDKVTAPLAKVSKGFNDLAEQGENNIKQMGLGLGGILGAAAGISGSLEPALEMNRALGDVRSLGVAEDALDALNRKSLQFSIAYGENAKDFVSSAYLIEGAIKGLSGEQLATFTNTSNVLAKATKTDQATMGEYVGTLYNLQKQQADAMGKSAWVEQLGGQTALAVQLFRTSGAGMKDAFKEVGAIATTAGVDLAEQMAVIGTLSSTMEGGDAGGRYKALFENMGAGADKLGLKLADQQGKAMPILEIMEKLQGKLGDLTTASAGVKLTEAFGGEGAQVIGALAKDTGRLRAGIDQLGKVQGLEQAERMAKAMVDPWQQFGAAVQALRIVFGQVLIPILAPLMERLTGIGSALLRWTQLFPNIARVIGIVVLSVLALTLAMSALTFLVGMSKMVWLGLVTVWRVVQLLNLRGIAGFLLQAAVIGLYVAGLTLLYTTLGIIRGGMLLWQGAIWLVNAAMWANPVLLIVAGVMALIAVIVLAVVYWDEWTSALMNTAAFQWIAGQLDALASWFGSMGGWTGMAKAAWDGIVSIFQEAIAAVIDLLNKIPGVNIETTFGDLPEPPKVPDIGSVTAPGGIAALSPALQAAAPGQALLPIQAPLAMTPAVARVAALPAMADQGELARRQLNQAAPVLSPTRPSAVPAGGLLSSIQNTNTQNRGTHVENMNITTGKAMTPMELENMMAMAAG